MFLITHLKKSLQILQQSSSAFTGIFFNVYCYIFTLILCFNSVVQAKQIELGEFRSGTVGKYIEYFQETDQKLTLEQAKIHFAKPNKVKQGNNNSISLGIGVKPVWMKFSVSNSDDVQSPYRLAIETPWLDYIDTWLVNDHKISRHIIGGDGIAFEQRPMPYRFYAFEHQFPIGVTDVYIRIESKGPLAVPIHFSNKEEAIKRDISAAYEYGILYGILFALALYNLVLFIFIKQKEYGLYSLYLFGFALNSLSYTGQLHTIFTYNIGPLFQDWLDIFLMITYSIAGLHFARALLKTQQDAPKLDKFVTKITLIVPLAMLAGLLFQQLIFSMALSFLLNTSFVILFIAMGVCALNANRPFAKIFLFSSVTAAVCITISTLAVAGILIPYNDFTFKAIEIGMTFEAFLLAVILAKQFRMAKMDKLVAESYARTDALTGINNRRGFQEATYSAWHSIARTGRDASIVLIDLDSFKQVNDKFGHDAGDTILRTVATCIATTIRKADITARWGGEEFIIFLPETPQDQAAVQAERVRVAIEKLQTYINSTPLTVTASFGVAGSEHNRFNNTELSVNAFEQMVKAADEALYLAKNNGKNRIIISQADGQLTQHLPKTH
ncbi:sensor domain-containing diguanylate cyclase [Litorilituus lipolyticus]|uniref:diguanylate cyclase n=1 Tax=Litorilituus lipolyticus TaxID=2491017 RepID=A0A502KP90_9GAMM|nr:diguanylate cyclase [Litorilituus lipolyticus]TPH13432.1 GGDEF domain-containing protein [Litorilituus lipolyticus]